MAAARSHLPEEVGAQMEHFYLKRQREGLTASKAQTLPGLIRQDERAMFIRAHTAALLKQRGHDVSTLITNESVNLWRDRR